MREFVDKLNLFSQAVFHKRKAGKQYASVSILIQIYPCFIYNIIALVIFWYSSLALKEYVCNINVYRNIRGKMQRQEI